jgi:hypothetical protein
MNTTDQPDLTGIAAKMLQRIVAGDDVDDVVDAALFSLTDRHDASRLMTPRQLRRIANVLLHRAEEYRRLTAAIGDVLADEVEVAGMTLAKTKIAAKKPPAHIEAEQAA